MELRLQFVTLPAGLDLALVPSKQTTTLGDLNGHEWLPWLPDKSHPSYKKFKMLQIQTFGADYDDQKQLLDALHEKRGEDMFAANFTAFRDKSTEEVSSYCIWPGGVPTLLPRTDKVAFIRTEGVKPVLADWDRVVEAMGDQMEPMDLYPERFRVTGFPDEGLLKTIGEPLD